MLKWEKGPLKQYRFNINDFTSSQLIELQNLTDGLTLNSNLSDKLYYEIRDQIGERRAFYFRSSRSTDYLKKVQWIDGACKSINFQPKWLQNILDYATNELKETKPSNYPHYDTAESEVQFGSRKVPQKVALAGMRPGCEQISGWARLKQTFLPWYYAPDYDRHEPVYTFNLNCCFLKPLYSGMAAGVLLAVDHAYRFLKDFDKQNLGNFHDSKYDAIRNRHNSFLRGLARYTLRWGWRITLVTGSFCAVSQALCIYRLEDKVTHYLAAGFVPGVCWNWKKGPKLMLVTGCLFSLSLGLPIGLLITNTYNPRAEYFQKKIAPRILSPVHSFNWTPQMKKINQERFKSLIGLIDLEHSGTNLENTDLINHLFKPKPLRID